MTLRDHLSTIKDFDPEHEFLSRFTDSIVIATSDIADEVDGNVDIFLYLKDGRRYAFTVFTPDNAKTIMEREERNELVVADMIVVRRLDQASIADAMEEVLRNCMQPGGQPLERFGILQDQGRLTTHVLDTAQGCPAAGMAIEFWRLDGENKQLLKTVRTNNDGRTDAPLLAGDDFATGTYELVFSVGDYFAQTGLTTATPPFLDRVPVRFTISDPGTHYHVPLLTSPWAYSTYRGS